VADKIAATERWFAFAFGVIFSSVLLYLGAVQTNPTPLQIKIDVTILALAAAGVGAILPGSLHVSYRGYLRAGGALGLFALVFLSEPAIGKGVAHFVEPSVSARPAVESFLAAIDSKDARASWVLLGPSAKNHVSGGEPAWVELYRNDVSPLGELESRKLIGETQAESPSGAPPGIYREFRYRSKHTADGAFRLESVVVRANAERVWEIFAYQISPNTFA
jgi:hypothetical protein